MGRRNQVREQEKEAYAKAQELSRADTSAGTAASKTPVHPSAPIISLLSIVNCMNFIKVVTEWGLTVLTCDNFVAIQVNEEVARNELFEKPGRVNIEERRRQRAAARNPAYRIGENLAGLKLIWPSAALRPALHDGRTGCL